MQILQSPVRFKQRRKHDDGDLAPAVRRRMACKAQIFDWAAEAIGLPADDMEIKGNVIVSRSNPDKRKHWRNCSGQKASWMSYRNRQPGAESGRQSRNAVLGPVCRG
jgi:hypothetical protein